MFSRALIVAAALPFIGGAVPAAGQSRATEFAVLADQSWMLDPGSRGRGPIDHGTLMGASISQYPHPRLGVEVMLSGLELRDRPVRADRWYQGQIRAAFGVGAVYHPRTVGVVRPFVSGGLELLSLEQRWDGARIRDTEGAFGLFRDHESRRRRRRGVERRVNGLVQCTGRVHHTAVRSRGS